MFSDGEHRVLAWGSYWTGLERIYFDDELVLQSSTREEVFEFQRNNTRYRIEFCPHSIAIGQLRCAFFRDGELLSSLRSKRKKIINIRPVYAHIAACIIFGVLAGLAHLPLWAGFLSIMISFALTLLSNAKADEFIIEELQIPDKAAAPALK